MKKIFAVILTLILALSAAAFAEGTTITVGASPSPHAEILAVAKDILAEQGITLEIVEYADYIIPNTAVEQGDNDANYFQHVLYLNDFNEQNGTHLVSVAGIHYEPFGIYAGKTASLEELQDGATIAIPNDTTNEARALLLLQAQGLITLKEDAGLTATVLDIVDNPHNYKIQELEAAQLPLQLESVDLAVINGNYAMGAGLKGSDALAFEAADDEVKANYTNVLVCKEGNENSEAIQALAAALTSDQVKAFMEEKYEGQVEPVF